MLEEHKPDIVVLTLWTPLHLPVFKGLRGGWGACRDIREARSGADFAHTGRVTAAEVGAEWMVVEQDQLRNLSTFETITASYLNLKEAVLL